MNAQGVLLQKTVPVSRRVIPMIFSRDFESMLLNADLQHTSLSADIEQAAQQSGIRLGLPVPNYWDQAWDSYL